MEHIEKGEEAEKMSAEEGEATEPSSGCNARDELADLASSLMMAAAAAQAQQHDAGEELEENSHNNNHDEGETMRTNPLVKKTRKLLFRRLRVGVEDGRVFIGKFHCLDKQGNIILYDTVEYRQISPQISHDGQSSGGSAAVDGVTVTEGVTTEQRNLGLVLIPSSCRTSCHVECCLPEQFSLLSV